MPYALKKLSRGAIPSALKKAEHYRLLNEPYEAESICLDILEVDPSNQDALIMMILSLTDQFGREIEPACSKAQAALERLSDKYCRYYYSGIIFERRAKAHIQRGGPGAGHIAYEWFTEALTAFEQAMISCAPGNENALLRWNTVARILNKDAGIAPSDEKEEVLLTDNWE
jgi:hypothetical protein